MTCSSTLGESVHADSRQERRIEGVMFTSRTDSGGCQPILGRSAAIADAAPTRR